MKNKFTPATQNSQTIPINDKDRLPVVKTPSEIEFSAQIIPENLERFRADSTAFAGEIFDEALKALNEDTPNFDPKDYRIFIAVPLMDHNDLAVTSKSAKAQDRAELADVLKNGACVFFMKSGSGPTRLEIWIQDQRILVFDKHKLLIGRSDIQKGIIPDIDLTPYLAEYALKISRKQAWLIETNGRWFISLDENSHSPVFLNGKQSLEVGGSYEILDYARLGFGGSLEQSFLDMTLRIIKY